MALQGYKVVYEDENQQVIPHWDEAKNTEFDNSNTDIVSKDVQSAIKELNAKINNSSSSDTSCNIIRLEELDGYNSEYGTGADFAIPKNNGNDYVFTDHIYFIHRGDLSNLRWDRDEKDPTKWGKDNNHHYCATRLWKPLVSIPATASALKFNVIEGGVFVEKTYNSSTDHIFISIRTRILTNKNYTVYSTPTEVTFAQLQAIQIDPGVINAGTVNKNSVINTIKEQFTSLNQAALEKATVTRKFIQQALDGLSSDDILVFPKNCRFTVAFDPDAYDYGYINRRYTYPANGDLEDPTFLDGYHNTDYLHMKFVGFFIDKEVHIDLNGSTIEMIPNWLPSCDVFRIGPRYKHSNTHPSNLEYPTGDSRPKNTSIVNGKILGPEFGMYFPYYTPDYEHSPCVSADDTVILKNLTLSRALGDGISLASLNTYDSTEIAPSNNIRPGGIAFLNTQGVLNNNGSISSTSDPNQRCTNEYYRIASWNVNSYPDVGYVPRPFFKDAANSVHYIDTAKGYINEQVTIAYYNNNKVKIGYEVINFGDTMNVPAGATLCKFGMTAKSSLFAGGSLLSIVVTAITWNKNSVIENCNISNCGRDGMTLAAIINPTLKNIYIKDCEQAAIDVENNAYVDDDIKVENLVIERESRGISCTTGAHFQLVNSKISGIGSDMPAVSISDSDIQWLTLGSKPNETGDTTFNSNITKFKRVIRNSIIRNAVYSVYTLFDNCIFTGHFDILQHSQYNGKHLNTYKDCTFKTTNLSPGIYYNCIFRCDDLSLDIYYGSTPENSLYKFVDCKFDINSISTLNHYGTTNPRTLTNSGALLDIIRCTLNIRGHKTLYNYDLFGTTISNTNFQGTYIRTLKDSIINYSPSNSDYFELFITPYTNAVIEHNLFNPTTESDKVSLLHFFLRSIADNDVYNVSIKNNLVKHYCTDPNDKSRFVFVHILNKDDNVHFDITDNVFLNVSDTVKVVNTLPTAGETDIYYYHKSTQKYYIWDADNSTFVEYEDDNNNVYTDIIDVVFANTDSIAEDTVSVNLESEGLDVLVTTINKSITNSLQISDNTRVNHER